jgi:selenocysteine lyase/cysteine desulfurase
LNLWTTGAVLPVRAIAEIAHDRAPSSSSTARRRRRDPLPARGSRCRPVRLAAQKWLAWPGRDGALVVDPAAVERRAVARGYFSFETVDGTGGATWWRDARRFEASGYHRPSVVGMARLIGWLSMFVGLDFVQRRGPAMAAAAIDRLEAIPA